jgi:osmoprotectant transport system permease protein
LHTLPVGFEKVKLSVALLGVLSCLLADFMSYSPNRLAAGEGVSLLSLGNWWEPLSVLVLCLSIAVLSFRTWFRGRNWSLISANILMLAILVIAKRYANGVSGSTTPYARASLGWGFWLLVFVCITVTIESAQGKDKSAINRLIIFLIPSVGLSALFLSGHLDNISLVKELLNRQDRFVEECWVHLVLAYSAVALSSLIGIPLAILLFKKPSLESRGFFILNIIQTIPSIALFGLLIAPLAYLSMRFNWLQKIGFQGIGWAPAVIALFLYALLPIVRNTYTGFKSIDPSVVEAASGMGMNGWQILTRVELPLISPIVLNGIRIAAVQSVGNTAVAALIGAGGLGIFIFQGLGQAATGLILLGAIPTIMIAVLTDLVMQGAIEWFRPGRKS